jgi:hypothetical protein
MQNYSAPRAPYLLAPRQTSRLGKASLLIALTVFLLVLASLIVLVILLETKSKAENTVMAIMLIGWVFAPGGHFIGLLLGLIDVFRSRSKKLVPALGIAANAVLGGIGLTVLVLVINLMIRAMGAFH